MPEKLLSPTIQNPISEHMSLRFMERVLAFPRFPEDGVIASPGFAYDQHLRYRSEDVAEQVEAARQRLELTPDFTQFLSGTIEELAKKYPGDAEKWNTEFLGKNIDHETTLPEVEKAGAANCFVRGVAFSGILQGLGIEARVMHGDWIETSREKVIGSYAAGDAVEYRDSRGGAGSGVRYLKGELGEFHAFSLIRYKGKLYFADPALMVKEESSNISHPLVREVTEEELLSRDIAFDLPNGKKRHYAFKPTSLVLPEAHSI